MDRFFATEIPPAGGTVRLSQEESHHLRRVGRRQPGEVIALCDGRGRLAMAEIRAHERGGSVCVVQAVEQVSPGPARRITVAVGLIRPNRMSWLVEKACELGVGRIEPLVCRFGNVRSTGAGHLHRVAVAAMKQSEQAYLTEIREPLSFTEWLGGSHSGLRIVAHRDEHAGSMAALKFQSGAEIEVAVGPEGGFAPDEIEKLLAEGFVPVRLSDAILRTETAVATALAQLHLKI